MLAGATDHKIRLWDGADFDQYRTIDGHDRTIYASAFHPSGRLAATGCKNGRIKLWDVALGRAIRTMEAGGRVDALAFDRDGALLYSGGSTGVCIWDTANGRDRGRVGNPRSAVWAMDLHHDCRTLAVSDKTGARLFDLTGKRSPIVMQAPNEEICSVALHRKRPLLAGGSKTGQLVLWDTRSGKLLQTVKAHEGHVFGVAFDPSGTCLASGGADKLACLWNVLPRKRTRSF